MSPYGHTQTVESININSTNAKIPLPSKPWNSLICQADDLYTSLFWGIQESKGPTETQPLGKARTGVLALTKAPSLPCPPGAEAALRT